MRKFEIHCIVDGWAIERLRDRACVRLAGNDALRFKRSFSDERTVEGQDRVCELWFTLGTPSATGKRDERF